MVVLGFLAGAALIGLFYLYFSPKSSKMQKFAALGALILSGLTILVCGAVIVIGGNGEDNDPYAFTIPGEAPQSKPKANNSVELIIFLVILLLVFLLIVYLGFRQRKKKIPEKPAAAAGDDDFFSDEP